MPTVDRITNRFLQSDKYVPPVPKIKKDPRQVPYFERNGKGFGVLISYGGTRSFFVLGKVENVDGKMTSVRMMLKPSYVRDGKTGLSLKEAREMAEPIIKQFALGNDPRLVRQQKKDDAAKRRADTYGKAVENFIELFHKGKKENKSWAEVKRLLLWPEGGKPPRRETKIDEDPHLWKGRPVSEITDVDIVHLLQKIIAAGHGYAANRVYAAMNTFFKWCVTVEGGKRIVSSPMKDISRPYDKEKSRDRVFEDEELKALWSGADRLERTPGAFLKILMLTGKRRGAVLAMRWDEISDNWVWTPSADKQSRTKRAFKAPLPPLAQQIIKGLSAIKGNPYVFASTRKSGTHIDAGTPLQRKVRQESGIDDFLFHHIRHTVETKLAKGWDIDGETYRVPPHIRDLVLDHVPLRGSGAGYDHHDYADEISEALSSWANRLEDIAMPEGVMALR